MWGPEPNFSGHQNRALLKLIKPGLSWENWCLSINVLITMWQMLPRLTIRIFIVCVVFCCESCVLCVWLWTLRWKWESSTHLKVLHCFVHPSFSSPSSWVKYEIKFDKHKLSIAGLLFDVYGIKWTSRLSCWLHLRHCCRSLVP